MGGQWGKAKNMAGRWGKLKLFGRGGESAAAAVCCGGCRRQGEAKGSGAG